MRPVSRCPVRLGRYGKNETQSLCGVMDCTTVFETVSCRFESGQRGQLYWGDSPIAWRAALQNLTCSARLESCDGCSSPTSLISILHGAGGASVSAADCKSALPELEGSTPSVPTNYTAKSGCSRLIVTYQILPKG